MADSSPLRKPELRMTDDSFAGIAQLVERNLAKVDVAGSSPVSRSVSSFGMRRSDRLHSAAI